MNRFSKKLLVVSWVLSSLFYVTAQAAPKSKMIEFWNDIEASSGLKINHTAWQKILDRYVDENHASGINRFNYDQVSDADKQSLADYLAYLQSMDPRQLNRPTSKAFWLNLYNATVVSMILDAKPKNSIRNLGSVWRKKRLKVVFQEMSLDDIEHGVLRPFYNDPRIHFGLTPAAIGSGDLAAQAYTVSNVDELLERNTKRFFNNSTKGVYIDGKSLVVSSIFKWYKSDFGKDTNDVKSFINKYVTEDLRTQINQTSKIKYQYNWELNKP